MKNKMLGFLFTASMFTALSGCVASSTDLETEEGDAEQLVSACIAEPSPRNTTALVVSAYDKVLNQYDMTALETMFDESYTQHNPTVADGRAGLAAFVAFRKAQQPEAHNEIKRVIAQGDLVTLHVHVTRTAAERNDEHAGIAIVDIFRVANGKIVEHWDVIQPVPATSMNGHTMFDGGGL